MTLWGLPWQSWVVIWICVSIIVSPFIGRFCGLSTINEEEEEAYRKWLGL